MGAAAILVKSPKQSNEQVAQGATIAHQVASIILGDTIVYDAQRQVTLNLKQRTGTNSKT